jgi:PleD family two-component response regulator
MTAQPRKILAVMTDLFFSAKIHDMAKKLGMSVEFLKDKSTVMEKVRDKPSLVIFDLNCDAAEPLSIIRAMKNDPETKRVSTIGFVSHVQTELKLEAQESGCDMVVARSVFAQNLPVILKRHATAPPARP